jgi:hypothetical protein
LASTSNGGRIRPACPTAVMSGADSLLLTLLIASTQAANSPTCSSTGSKRGRAEGNIRSSRQLHPSVCVRLIAKAPLVSGAEALPLEQVRGTSLEVQTGGRLAHCRTVEPEIVRARSRTASEARTASHVHATSRGFPILPAAASYPACRRSLMPEAEKSEAPFTLVLVSSTILMGSANCFNVL